MVEFAVDGVRLECHERFAELVASQGVKKYAMTMGVTPRQVNRMLADAQPNPVERIIVCLKAATPECSMKAMDYICEQMGGYFVRAEGISDATVNAVRECAEAIAAISDGHLSHVDMGEVRQAIRALSSLIVAIKKRPGKQGA